MTKTLNTNHKTSKTKIIENTDCILKSHHIHLAWPISSATPTIFDTLHHFVTALTLYNNTNTSYIMTFNFADIVHYAASGAGSPIIPMPIKHSQEQQGKKSHSSKSTKSTSSSRAHSTSSSRTSTISAPLPRTSTQQPRNSVASS